MCVNPVIYFRTAPKHGANKHGAMTGPIVLPPPCPLMITPIDFSHGDELIRRGYEDSCEYLDAVARGEAPVPLLMEMHQHDRPVGTAAESE